ncbi:unnamed protein product [Litomosoides sigmodontis]|uniref:Lipid-binding serum glycoprotein C-terminal domain-containing protein n=1 Tax=Litomosoides sigmodontis TaxID=42156 RepID=A0A3P6T9N6_LITSI|nr:unnamed protein product [Litomosoides sigmodontis]
MSYECFAILSSYVVISSALLRQNSPGRPFIPPPECGNYINNTETLTPSVLQIHKRNDSPGFKIRFSRNMFRYGNSMISQILNQKIRNIRIPSFTQCLPEVNGCAYLRNILVTNYLCARHIALFPISHNEIGLNIQNFDLSLSGQLGGQVVVLLPLPLCGTLCIDTRQISISLQVAIERNAYNGAAYIRMTKCSLTLGYLNIYIVGGGLIGEIINNNFRSKIISKFYATLPEKFCNMIPPLLDEHVNSQLINVPQKISITQMISYISDLVGRPKKLPEYCYSDICKRYHSTSVSSVSRKHSTKAILTGVPNVVSTEQKAISSNKLLAKSEQFINNTLLNVAALPETNGQKTFAPVRIITKFPQKIGLTDANNNDNGWQQCANCDYEKNELISYYANGIINRIQKCASDMVLSTSLLDSSSTNSDLTLNLLGEFSPNAQGDTPFAPPVLEFPVQDSGKMLDLLVSDYTFNTLLYHLHRRGVFTFRIGPEIPVIGDLLNLTCAADDIDFELSVELQDNEDLNNNATLNETNSQNERKRRHTTVDTFLNFGTIIIEFVIDGLIYLDGTTTQVGHIRIIAVSAITVEVKGDRVVSKVQIQRMDFVDVDKTFGLPEEAFTNLSDLARGIITKAINRKLSSGIPIIVPQLGLPIQMHNTNLQIVEHALFISTDANFPLSANRLPYQSVYALLRVI